MPDVDVVVVGAGLAGLVAARDLMRSGLQVVVVEARDRVGGRVLNAELPGGAPIEVGGQWVGPGQTEILDLIAELGLSLFPTHTQGRKVLDFNGRALTYTGRIPRLNPLVLADIGYGSWRLDRLTRRLPPPGSTVNAPAAALDGQTLATWLHRHLHTHGGREFLRLITRAVFTTEPEDLSALWAFRAHPRGATRGQGQVELPRDRRGVGGQRHQNPSSRRGDTVRAAGHYRRAAGAQRPNPLPARAARRP